MKFRRQILIHLLWLLPVAFWPHSNSYDAAKFTILAMAVGLWLGHAAWLEWRGHSGLPMGNRGLTIWGSLVFLLGIGLFASANPTLVVRAGLLISLFGMVTLQTSRQIGGLQGQKPLLAAVTLGASLAGIYGLLQMAHLLPGAAPFSGYPPGISTLGNQNYLAGFMAVAFWPALVLLRHTRQMWHRVVIIVSMTLILVTLALAGATGPQVAILTAGGLVAPCVVLVIKGRGRLVPMVLAGLLILVAASGLWLMFDAPLHHKLLAANHGDIRRTDWLAAVDMLKSDPILGVGAGNYLVQWPEARARLTTSGAAPDIPWGTPISTRTHNDPLQWVAETGAIGLFWLASLLVTFAVAWWRRFLVFSPRDQVDHLLLTAGVLTVAVHSLVSFPFHLPATSLVFAFLLGLLFLNDGADNLRESNRMGKIQGLVLAMVALVLVGGSLQEFRGDLLTASGRRHFTQGKIKMAVTQLGQGVRQMKWPGPGRLYLGLAQTALGRIEEAEDNFRISLNDRPSFEAHLALAESDVNRGDYSAAESHLDLVKNCGPQLGFIHQEKFLRAFMLVHQGRLALAHKEFEQLLKEDPNQHRALLGLGYLEAQLDHPDRAKEFYNQALAVIDKQMAEFRTNPGQESAAFRVRLQQNRQVASRALEALARTP